MPLRQVLLAGPGKVSMGIMMPSRRAAICVEFQLIKSPSKSICQHTH